MIDILEKLYNKEITEKEAYALCREVVNKHQDDFISIQSELGFNDREWNAFRWSAFLSDIACWRYDGWPTDCVLCQYPLSYEVAEDWMCEDGKPRHRRCLYEAKKEID